MLTIIIGKRNKKLVMPYGLLQLHRKYLNYKVYDKNIKNLS